jgi:uncharacterized short protein YbdD (DUF466 family)
MSQGWIITHRKLRESSFYKDSQAVHLWIHLLISANHKDAQVVRGNKVYEVKRGQLITGRKLLSSETGINESKLQRLLKVFEKCHMIEQQTNNVNRLVSIINYDQYQTSEQQVNSKRTASEQQVNTNNNDNNKNNDKELNRNIRANTSATKTIEQREKEFYSKISEHWKKSHSDMPKEEVREFFDYWTERGDSDKKMRFEKEKTFGISRRMTTWKKNNFGGNDTAEEPKLHII